MLWELCHLSWTAVPSRLQLDVGGVAMTPRQSVDATQGRPSLLSGASCSVFTGSVLVKLVQKGEELLKNVIFEYRF